MNELQLSNINSISRNTELIAAEINNIKNQTKKMVIYNSIEIGRRLVEAKALVPHGEWGQWLEKSVEYSQRTANNLMRLFEEYGNNQLALLNSDVSQTFANLSYSKAVALLGVEDKEEFIQEHDVDNMSTRELQQAIKDREKALKEKQELENKLKNIEKELLTEKEHSSKINKNYQELEETNNKYHEKSEQLKKELDKVMSELSKAKFSEDKEEVEKLQSLIKEMESDILNSQNKIIELENQLKEKPIEVSATIVEEKIPEEVEKEIILLRKKAQDNSIILKFSLQFDDLVENFRGLLGTLSEMQNSNKEEHEKYRQAISGLINKMSEKL